MKTISTTDLRVKLPKIRREVALRREKIAVTYYQEIIGFLAPILEAEAIADIKTTGEISLSSFRTNLTVSWEQMQFDCDCLWITSHKRKVMAFVSPRFFEDAIAEATGKEPSFFLKKAEDLDELLTIGQKIRIFIYKDHHENGIIEIRGIVDGYFVCRQWFRHKKRWNYSLRDRYFLETWNNAGWLSKAK